MDFPQTPGDWRYRQSGNLSAAEFGAGQFRIECNRANRTISLVRPGGASGAAPAMHVLTETREGTLGTTPQGQQPPTVAAMLPAGDPLLDAMAFSKGRFAIETSGLPTLYLPSWPEVTRVIEDCR
jgi:hypothetical protein